MDPFKQKKIAFMERLEREAGLGRVDFDIMDVLRGINSLPDYFTTSSCSGRIMIASAERLGFSKSVRSMGSFELVSKWHRPVTMGEVREAMERLSDAWLMVRSAILHVVARRLDEAEELLRLARSSGFKHSGISSIKEWGYLVELLGEDRMDVPLKVRGKLIYDDLDPLVDAANETLMFAKLRLADLVRSIENALMSGGYPESRLIKVPYRQFKNEMGARPAGLP
ncbi:hypothetical protein GCM10007981_12830 [Thermocladium modestius]|uniref:tRNA(Phe) 7-((3-amino-3-carboxypropyl)-4-demethylwyosine(37)-N(4))-methyltransferase n=1 Tax=Thermocladium modestius TaxID=62609 RepID=A0A830GZ67_9CREN|nr:hypothetical protein [Thermocladium modestius]GGP21353.1 hypothetical protein GCM10007981_12830 [Thermocladium modestius]